MFVAVGFFTFVGVVVVGTGLTTADGLAVAPTADFIAALVTPVLGEVVAVLAACVAGIVPVAVEVFAPLPPVKALPAELDGSEVKLEAVPGVRVGKFRL